MNKNFGETNLQESKCPTCHKRFLLMHIFPPASSVFFPLTWVKSICGNPSCSIANSLGERFIATAAREGLERALAQAERRDSSGMITSLDDTRVEADGGGGPGGGGGGGGAASFCNSELVWLDCLRASF